MSQRIATQLMTKSINFASSTDKIDCGADFIGTGDVTVCGWIKKRRGTVSTNLFHNGQYTLYYQESGLQRLNLSSNNLTVASSSAISDKFNNWFFLSVTRTSAGVVNFRINGVLSGTANQSSGTPVSGSTNVWLGNYSVGTGGFNGSVKNWQVFNRILTTTEQDNIYYNGINPSDYTTSIVRDFTFENDTSTTIYSKHDITKTGTITGATFSQDVPVKNRYRSGENLFKSKLDGSAGISPTGAAAITTTGWIEDQRLRWYFTAPAASASGGYDTSVLSNGLPTLKLSTLNATGRARSGLDVTLAGSNISGISLYSCLRVKPNTTYTINIYCKTNNATSDSAYLSLAEYSENGVILRTLAGNKLSGTNDWTLLTLTFTTTVNAALLAPRAYLDVAGNISDAWFDINSLTLTETTPTTRSTASNRVAVRDCGTALRFVGSNSIQIPHQSYLTGFSSFTVVALVKRAENGVGQFIISKRNATNIRYELATTSTNFITFSVGNGTTESAATSTKKIVDKEWHTVVGVYDGANVYVYIDGQQTGNTTALTGTVNTSTSDLYIGSRAGASNFSGIIDETRIFSRAFSATEISNLYFNNIVPRDGLVGEWLFNETTGSTALDTSGNGNNGTITGATYTTDVWMRPRTNV